MGCSSAQPPEPPAKPVVTNQQLETYWFAKNKINVWLRNDGKDGWVRISYETTSTDTSWDIKRRSGAEVWLRHNLTSEDDSEYVLQGETRTYTAGSWSCYTFMKAGQSKHIQLEMPGHSSWDTQSSAQAEGVAEVPKDAVIK